MTHWTQLCQTTPHTRGIMESRLRGSHKPTGECHKKNPSPYICVQILCSPKWELVVAFCSSKALSSYRQIRRKYREQVWRLEQKVAAMMDSGGSKAAGEVLEWKREETVLWFCDSLEWPRIIFVSFLFINKYLYIYKYIYLSTNLWHLQIPNGFLEGNHRVFSVVEY